MPICTCTTYPPSPASPGGYRANRDDCPTHGRVIVTEDSDPAAILIIRDVPACTSCGLIGHLAENCPKS